MKFRIDFCQNWVPIFMVDLNLYEIEESALVELETGNLSVKDSATY